MTLIADEHEPEEIIRLMQQSIPVTVSPLNRMHMSDFFFGNSLGLTLQLSRKQAGELVGNIDEAEDQIRDYYNQADKNYQIIEGFISPFKLRSNKVIPVNAHTKSNIVSTRDLGAKLYCYNVDITGKIHGHSFSTLNESTLHAWIHRLAELGVPTYYTANWASTARLLVAIYKNEQKPPEDHNTLNRVIRPKLVIKNQDPFLKALMYLSHAYRLNIGETRAQTLVDNFANIFDLITSDVDEIASCEGIGKATAKKILASLGRIL